jgi:6-pyruvoyl-tetrahydropterin synthase
MSTDTQFSIHLSKDTFKFNASHFVAYPGFRERLHGHNYRVAVTLFGSHEIGRDGYVLDFGCVKSAAKKVCKEMNEYFLVPMLSDVLQITLVEGREDEMCGQCEDRANDNGRKEKKLKRTYPGSVTIQCEDGSKFIFPRQDCLLLPIMHSTCEELAIYVYGQLLKGLNRDYLESHGVTAMEVKVSESTGQDAMFRRQIPKKEDNGGAFDVASYITKDPIPAMPCLTETEAAIRKVDTSY